MNEFSLNAEQCKVLGKLINTINFIPESLTDPLLYPSPRLSASVRADFYFFMVAIDHQTHPVGEVFEAELGSRLLHGADLLYALALRRLNEDEQFFEPTRIEKLTLQEFKELFTVKTPRNTIVTIHNPETRLQLWHDAAEKLQKHDSTGILDYFERIRTQNNEKILTAHSVLKALQIFRAYSDPVRKKSSLLLKFLLRTNLLTIKDSSTLGMPIDNHLIRLALRVGMVEINDNQLTQKILRRKPFTEQEDVTLRKAVKEAYDLVLEAASKSAIILDDLFWNVGRTCCMKDAPNCVMKRKEPLELLKERLQLKSAAFCPFIEVCRSARDDDRRRLTEPAFRSIYY